SQGHENLVLFCCEGRDAYFFRGWQCVMLIPLVACGGNLRTTLRPQPSGRIVAGRDDVQPEGAVFREPNFAEARVEVAVAIAQVLAESVDAGKVPQIARRVRCNVRRLLPVVQASVGIGNLIGNLKLQRQKIDAPGAEIHCVQCLGFAERRRGPGLRNQSQSMLSIKAHLSAYGTNLVGGLLSCRAPRVNPEISVARIAQAGSPQRLMSCDQRLLGFVDLSCCITMENCA